MILWNVYLCDSSDFYAKLLSIWKLKSSYLTMKPSVHSGSECIQHPKFSAGQGVISPSASTSFSPSTHLSVTIKYFKFSKISCKWNYLIDIFSLEGFLQSA